MRGRLVLEKRHMTQAVCMERSPRIEFINKTRNEIWCFLRQSRAMRSQSSTSGSRGRTGGDWALPSHPPPPSPPLSAPTTRAWVSQMDVTVIYQARDGKHADGDQHMARSASPSLATNLCHLHDHTHASFDIRFIIWRANAAHTVSFSYQKQNGNGCEHESWGVHYYQL